MHLKTNTADSISRQEIILKSVWMCKNLTNLPVVNIMFDSAAVDG